MYSILPLADIVFFQYPLLQYVFYSYVQALTLHSQSFPILNERALLPELCHMQESGWEPRSPRSRSCILTPILLPWPPAFELQHAQNSIALRLLGETLPGDIIQDSSYCMFVFNNWQNKKEE